MIEGFSVTLEDAAQLPSRRAALEELYSLIPRSVAVNHHAAIQYVTMDPRFVLWPASVPNSKGDPPKHHGGMGGLIRHVTQMLRSALATASATPDEIDLDALTLGILWHDIGKLDEYECRIQHMPNGEFVMSAKRYQTAYPVPHLPRSIMRWVEFTVKQGASWASGRAPLVEHINHIILGHHGRLDWGSPVVPQTLTALIVHHADVQSVVLDGGKNPELRH